MISETTQTCRYDLRHGGPYDRGRADSYYNREYGPHYFAGDSYSGPRIELLQMTAAQIVAYTAGYTDNESSGDHKEWL